MPYASAVLADSPVHYYRLNEPSGTSAVDSGSGANNGTYVSCALNQGSFVQNDAAAASVGFNGSTAEVDCPTKFPCVGPFTVEGWIHGSAWGGGAFGNERMAAVGQFPDGGWGLGVNAGGNPLMTFFDVADHPDTNTVLATGKNYHLAVTYDGSSVIKFYVNGALTNTITGATMLDPGSGYTTSYIGRATYTSAASDQFNGYLAEVAIYTTVLSAARIRAHFNASGNVLTIGTPTLTNSFPVSIAKPSKPADDAGVSPGDVIFVLVGADNSAGAGQNGIGDSALTPPTGFTSDGHYTGSANNWLEWLMHRTADGTEGSTFTPTASLTGADGGAVCVVLRGIDPTNPVVALSEPETLNTNSYVTDTVNCITRSRIVPMVAMAVNASSTSTLGWPGGLDQHAGGAGSSSGNMTTYLGWGSSNYNGSAGLGGETITCSTSQYAIYTQFALRLAQTPQVGVDVVQAYYSTSLTDAYPAPVHPGNTLVVGFQKFGQQGGSAAAPNITSVTDGGSANTWIHMTGAKTQQSPSSNYALLTDFYYVENCAVFFGGPSQRPNVVTTEDVSTYCRMLLIELSPSVHDQAVGGHAHLVGSGTQQISAGTITPTRGDGVGVFLGNVDNDGTGAWGAMGWTEPTIVIHSDGAGAGGTYNSMALLSDTPVADNFENLYHVAPIDFCASGTTFIPTPSGGPVAITATAAAVAAATCKVTASAKLAPAAVAVALTTASARAAALLSPSAQTTAASTAAVRATAALSPSAQAGATATAVITASLVPLLSPSAQAATAAVALVTAKTAISASAQALGAATAVVVGTAVPFFSASAAAVGVAAVGLTAALPVSLAAQAVAGATGAVRAGPVLAPAAQAVSTASAVVTSATVPLLVSSAQAASAAVAVLRASAVLVPVAGASTQASAVVATAIFLSPHATAMTHAGAIVVTVLSYAFVTSTSMTYALATTEST